MGLACSITVALLRICSFLVNCRILSVIFIYIIVILQVQEITRFRKRRALGLLSSVAKIVGNNYCTETSVQPATIEVREYSIRVCSFREPE